MFDIEKWTDTSFSFKINGVYVSKDEGEPEYEVDGTTNEVYDDDVDSQITPCLIMALLDTGFIGEVP